MEKITFKETIGNSQSGLNKFNNNRQLAIESSKADAVIKTYDFLIEPKFIKWFYKQLYRVGVSKFIELASRAIEGREPKKLFAKLLKEAA